MFDFLFKDKDGELQNWIDIINSDIAKLNLRRLAINKAIGMIARAIAKSEILVISGGQRQRDDLAYRLNVKPNDNEYATEFWMHVVEYIVAQGKCLIVQVKNKFYIAETWTENDNVLKARTYKNVTIKCAGKTLTLEKQFKSSDVMMIRLEPEKAPWRAFLVETLDMLDKTASNINAAMMIASTPRFKLKTDSNGTFITKNADGTVRKLTSDEYSEKVKKLLSAEKLTVILSPNGVDLSQLKIETTAKAEEIKKLEDETYELAARAFDIPKACFFGEITEKADSTNEFITYAAGPVAEAINDAMNDCIVGEEDWIKGEEITVFTGRFKHVDVVGNADKLRYLREIGYSLDEIFWLTGMPEQRTEFSKARALTLNIQSDTSQKSGGKEGENE